MFDTRESASGRCAYLIQIEKTKTRKAVNGKYTAKVVQVIEPSAAVRVSPPLPVHEHYGQWPEEAIKNAFEEAERLVARSVAMSVVTGRPHGTRD